MSFPENVLDVAEKICDKVGIILKGKMVMTGSMEEVREASKDGSLEDFFLSVAGKHEIAGMDDNSSAAHSKEPAAEKEPSVGKEESGK